MAVYPAHKSVLVIEPVDVTDDDMSLLAMEDNPLDILQYFISANDNEPRYKSKIYEDFIENFEFDENDRKEKSLICRICGDRFKKKFLFMNLLKNTAWAREQANCSNESILNAISKDRINSIRSRNNKYALVIADSKFQNFCKERVTMSGVANNPNTFSSTVPKKGMVHDKVSNVIKSGVLGGKGDSVNAECAMPHLVAAYPNESWTRAKVNNAFATLMSHGDLVKVQVLDVYGNPTGAFAQGKYRINTRTAVDHPVAVVPHPVVPPAPHPVVQPVQPVSVAAPVVRGGPPKSSEKIALDDFLNKNSHRDFIFTIDDIINEYPGLDRLKVQKRLIDALNKTNLNKSVIRVKQGRYRHMPIENAAPKTVEDISNTMSGSLDLDKIAAELIKNGVPFSKVNDLMKRLENN